VSYDSHMCMHCEFVIYSIHVVGNETKWSTFLCATMYILLPFAAIKNEDLELSLFRFRNGVYKYRNGLWPMQYTCVFDTLERWL